MAIPHRTVVGACVLILTVGDPVAAQQTGAVPDSGQVWHEDAWTEIVRRDGVSIDYIFYPDADNEHGGVVLRLRNHTERPVRYAFTVIFRAPEADSSASAEGRLGPGEMKTGGQAGLFWIPFAEEDHNIGEIGLSDLKIMPQPDS